MAGEEERVFRDKDGQPMKDEDGKPMLWAPGQKLLVTDAGSGRSYVATTSAPSEIHLIGWHGHEEAPATFALPSHAHMFPLLGLFASGTRQLWRGLRETLVIPKNERQPQQQQAVDEFLGLIFPVPADELLGTVDETTRIRTALVCNNPRVEAKAQLEGSLFAGDAAFREERIAIYIARTFGPEGFKHCLGFVLAAYEAQNDGLFSWDLNDHLARLGYRKKAGGGYSDRVRKMATAVTQILICLELLSVIEKKALGRHPERLEFVRKRLFNWEEFSATLQRDEVLGLETIDFELKIRATDWWYGRAMRREDGRSAQYTKLLRKLVKENARKHPSTMVLAALLAIKWRMSPERVKLRVESLLSWCGVEPTDHNVRRSIRTLERELTHMTRQEYLGAWEHDGEERLPSECRNPLECAVTLYPPAWFAEQLPFLKRGREAIITGAEMKGGDRPLTKEELVVALTNTGLSMDVFAERIGVSKRHLRQVKNGHKTLSLRLSRRIREEFPAFIPS